MKKLYLILLSATLCAPAAVAQNHLKNVPKWINTSKESESPTLIVTGNRDYRVNDSDNERGGQACLLDVNFDTGLPGTWTNTMVNANENWVYSATGGNPDGHMDIQYDASLGLQNESLITPSVDLSSITAPTLKFDWFMSYYWGVDPNDNYDLTVSISTNGGGSWTDLWTESDEGTFTSYTWYTKNIDLSLYASATAAIFRFNYYGSDGAQAKLDNVSVCTAQNDLLAETVFTGDVLNDYAYSQVPVSQPFSLMTGLVYSNVGATTLTNVSIDEETFSFVANSNVYSSTVPGLASMAPGASDTVWVNTGYVPSMVDTFYHYFMATADQADANPADNENVQYLLITEDTWAHDFELEDYFAFGYASSAQVASLGFEMGAAYFCHTDGSTIYAVDFPLGSTTTAATVVVNIYEDDLSAPVSSTIYDLQPGDLSTNSVNFIHVPLDNPVPMASESIYVATIAIEGGDDAYIIGNDLDDGDGAQFLYSVYDDAWYTWTGLTTAIRLRVSYTVGTGKEETASNFEMYPNPVIANQVSVNFVPGSDDNYILRVFNATGSIVQIQSFNGIAGQSKNLKLNLKNLASGIYQVQIFGGTEVLTQKLIVQ